MKLSLKTVVAPALVLVVICLCVSAALGATNYLTKNQIAAAQAAKAEQSRKIVLADAQTFADGANGSFVGKSGSKTVGYVFVTEGKGYGGTIQVMTGIGTDDQIKGVVILSHNETPGLGANATKQSFTNGYLQAAQPLEVAKNAPSVDGNIQAMTGATITTAAVTDAVNLAIEAYHSLKGDN